MKRSLISSGIAIIVFAISPATSFGDFLMIDDFESGAGSILVGPEQTGSVELDIFGIDPARTIGGERNIFVDGEAEQIDSQISVNMFDPGGGNPFYNELFNFNSFGTAGYRWGQNNDLNLALNQLDLEVSNLESSIDVGFGFETNIYITLTSGRGSAAEKTETVIKTTIDSDQTDLTVSWRAAEFSDIDFKDVDHIELGFEGFDYIGQLSSFSVNAVPEPASASLLLGCLLFAGTRRLRIPS